MPKKRLTDENVAKIDRPEQGKQIDYYDTVMPGLILRVNYGGRTVWRALHYVKSAKDGKTIPTTFKLGRYPIMRVKEARDAARQFLFDPQKALANRETGTFRQVAENFIKRHVEANNLRSQPEIERCLDKYVYPRWQHRQFREIKRGDVAELLDQIEDNHGARQADIVLAIIRKLMNWYAARNDDYVSVIVRGMHRANGGERKRKRILDDNELRAVWTACGEIATYGALLKTALLTAQRKDKVATMQWTDLHDGVWSIPTEQREKTHAGSLQLPRLVLDVIERQPRIVGNPYVFAGRGHGPFNSFSRCKDELDTKLKGMPHWTVHDLRRTARSLMSRAGVRPDISERVLGHAIPGVEGVYDRHSYDEEKADALQRLATLVDSILNPTPANVTDLNERRRHSHP